MKFHINPTNGEPGRCSARVACPFGDLEGDHYSTAAEARAAYERVMETEAQASRLEAAQERERELRATLSAQEEELSEKRKRARELKLQADDLSLEGRAAEATFAWEDYQDLMREHANVADARAKTWAALRSASEASAAAERELEATQAKGPAAKVGAKKAPKTPAPVRWSPCHGSPYGC